MSRRTHLALAAVLLSITASAGATPRASLPIAAERAPLVKPELRERPDLSARLIVKFHDGARARAEQADGALRFDGAPMPTARRDLDRALDRTVRFRPLLDLPAERLVALETRAALRTGVSSADLRGMLVVEAPDHRLQEIANTLWSSPLVEFVHWEQLAPPPPSSGGCHDIAPPTPSYEHQQGYLGPNPGLNMLAAWETFGARGAGVMIADCEYWFNENHEDLCGIVAEPGQTPHPTVISNGWHQHGTAVLGQLVAGDNGYGVTGLVPDATALFFPEWTVEGGHRRVTAIANAIASVNVGDIVVLEMQALGAGGGYAPAEVSPAVWTVVKTGTDAGVIVVAAAGNGNQNLDSAAYADYMGWGDSGAIIVGAGGPNTFHSKLAFSTYGSRVNLQGWGQGVMTTGYGAFSTIGGDPNQTYTASFNGTSSATPMVAAAAAAVQGVHRGIHGTNLSPAEMRELLIATGLPQGSGGHIGPFPDVFAAISAIWSGPTETPCDTATVLSTGTTIVGAEHAMGIGGPETTCGLAGANVVELEAWFIHDVECSGTIAITACDGDISSIAVYIDGCPSTGGTALACDMESCAPNQRPSLVLELAAGDRLHVRLGSVNGFETPSAVSIACGTDALTGDFNGDGTIDGVDLGLLLTAWGSAQTQFDLNADGVVDGIDLGILLTAWMAQ